MSAALLPSLLAASACSCHLLLASTTNLVCENKITVIGGHLVWEIFVHYPRAYFRLIYVRILFSKPTYIKGNAQHTRILKVIVNKFVVECGPCNLLVT